MAVGSSGDGVQFLDGLHQGRVHLHRLGVYMILIHLGGDRLIHNNCYNAKCIGDVPNTHHIIVKILLVYVYAVLLDSYLLQYRILSSNKLNTREYRQSTAGVETNGDLANVIKEGTTE